MTGKKALYVSELQIRWCFKDDFEIFFFLINKNICCDPLSELFHQDSCNDGHNLYFFFLKYGKLSLNYPNNPFLSGAMFVGVSPEINRIRIFSGENTRQVRG